MLCKKIAQFSKLKRVIFGHQFACTLHIFFVGNLEFHFKRTQRAILQIGRQWFLRTKFLHHIINKWLSKSLRVGMNRADVDAETLKLIRDAIFGSQRGHNFTTWHRRGILNARAQTKVPLTRRTTQVHVRLFLLLNHLFHHFSASPIRIQTHAHICAIDAIDFIDSATAHIRQFRERMVSQRRQTTMRRQMTVAVPTIEDQIEVSKHFLVHCRLKPAASFLQINPGQRFDTDFVVHTQCIVCGAGMSIMSRCMLHLFGLWINDYQATEFHLNLNGG
mmetsp:Transcript_44717/g.74044  ORF Transcript_44717/g.74044 Transcript_44717/m.74044 type:complete len:276 (+) Transcript_44717:108-935(+)